MTIWNDNITPDSALQKPTSKDCIARAQAQTFRVQAINMNRLGVCYV
jgi:hypothetical protein